MTHLQDIFTSKTTRWTGILCALFLWNCMAAPVLAAPVTQRPDSGSILEDTKLPPLVQPPKPAAPSIKVEDSRPDQLADDTHPILVSEFHLKGDLPVPASELVNLLAGETGKSHTLRGLNTLAGRLTTHLRDRGYLLAFAYVPAQEIKDGNVDIVVVPGVYGQILIQGDAHLKDSFLRGIFGNARNGAVITRAPLERALLIANEIPGLEVRSTFVPGKATGSADLVIVVRDAGKISGAAYTDNWGDRYTGRVRYGTQLSVNNLSGTGDTFTLGGLSSFQGMNNYDFGYNAYLGTGGLKAFLRRSQVSYSLGDTFADLGSTGTAEVISTGLSYPLVRNRAFSLVASLGFDNKKLVDDIATTGEHIPKTDNLWNIGISGNFSDTWGGGGANAFSLNYNRVNLGFDDAAAANTDDAGAQTAGAFGKLTASYQRRQYLRRNLQLNLSFSGQLTDKNLDSSEKIYLGGPTGVRAYPQNEASGDQGYRAGAEVSYRVPGLSTPKSGFYVSGYFDCGAVMLNKNQYVAGPNYRSLSGAGIGVLWTRDRDYAFRIDYAWKTSAEAAVSDTDKSAQLWLQAVKYF